MRRSGRLAAMVVAVVGASAIAACEKQEFEPPDREARVERADSLYSPALFDTVAWAGDSVRALEGSLVYSAECRSCHGPLGRGGTEYGAERGLDVPSLVEPDWEHAGDLEAVRHRVFVGHPEGMPTWGVARITPREIDAAAFYVLETLRPEVLGGRVP